MVREDVKELDKGIELLELMTKELKKIRDLCVDEEMSEQEKEDKVAQYLGKIIILSSQINNLDTFSAIGA